MVPSRLVLLFVFLLIFPSCDDNRYDVNTTGVPYELSIKRLDKDLFGYAVKDEEWLNNFNEKYGSFSVIYFEEIMRIGNPENAMTAGLANRFTNDPTWAQLQNIIETTFPNLENVQTELEAALKRYSVHFSVDNLPEVVAYNSGYNVGIYPSDSWLGIGLEWYCGNDHEIIEQLPPDLFPKYKLDKMTPEYMVPNAIKGYLYYQFRNKKSDKNLLSRMVHSGKVLFISAQLLDTDDYSSVLNYTRTEYGWCEENAYDIWKFLLENDLFFIEEPMQINKIMNDGPFTPGMPADSPGGVGNWVGLQMVREFMDDNPNISLAELAATDNDKVFLEYYKFK